MLAIMMWPIWIPIQMEICLAAARLPLGLTLLAWNGVPHEDSLHS